MNDIAIKLTYNGTDHVYVGRVPRAEDLYAQAVYERELYVSGCETLMKDMYETACELHALLREADGLTPEEIKQRIAQIASGATAGMDYTDPDLLAEAYPDAEGETKPACAEFAAVLAYQTGAAERSA